MFSGGQLRAAVEEYAAAPRPRGYIGLTRRFDPYRFVVVTSAELDSDTSNVDTLTALQDEYAGDLEIEAWGAEALSRRLRSEPNLVYAMFGAAWAKAWCGFEPAPRAPTAPASLGLVEAPVRVLNLVALEADAKSAEDTDPRRACHLYGVLARSLDDGHFPGHAASMRRRQASAAKAADEPETAFAILFQLVLERVVGGDTDSGRGDQELEELASAIGGVPEAKWSVLARVAAWYERGSDLSVLIPALQKIVAARDPDAALLCCLVVEQALVDGLYDLTPPRSLMVEVDEHTPQLLDDLSTLAADADSSDVVLRARLACAAADTLLTVGASSGQVQVAYGRVLQGAAAGRYGRARGMVISRGAYAFAIRGDAESAENLWRQSILASSEDGNYGDARHAMRAARYLSWDTGRPNLTGLELTTSALPNRQRLLASAHDPALNAYIGAHRGKLPDAFGDARRFLWEARIAGGWQEEVLALELFGDVLAAGGQGGPAVEVYIRAGATKKAVEHAEMLTDPLDVTQWINSAVRHCRAAAIGVIGAQATIVHNDQVADIVQLLLHAARGLWHAPNYFAPHPERDAVQAITAFGVRIPESAVDQILVLAAPALTVSTLLSAEIAALLVNAYYAVSNRRDDIADAIAAMMRIAEHGAEIWNLAKQIPQECRHPLVRAVCELADQGNKEAISVLATWRISTAPVQLAARQGCASLLRTPVGHPRTVTVVGTQESATVDLLLALLEADELINVAPAQLTAENARPAGGVLIVHTTVAPDEAPTPETANPAPSPLPQESTPPEPVEPDSAALTAAGPRGDLLLAIALHLTEMVEDHHDSGASRRRTVSALGNLVDRLPAHIASDIANRLAAVHRAPNLSITDQFEISSNTPLSRMRLNSGAGKLTEAALLVSARAFAASKATDPSLTERDERYAEQALTAAALLLRADDEVSRSRGAHVISAIARVIPRYAAQAAGLALHRCEYVRAIGTLHVPANDPLLVALAADPSRRVRASVAQRAHDLPDSVRAALVEDPDLAVRRTVQRPVNSRPENA